ncbi:MAG TPA: alkaline phosphatase D family protein [Planctomycetota bacterium]|nr:alkaline phosphatase D family protein [Planctomycetota bacterium]
MRRIVQPYLDRRTFLAGTVALAGASLWGCGATARVPVLSDDPFQLGVASGDPSADGVVLWTRLAPAPLTGGGMPPEPVAVRWELAADDGFREIVQQGEVTALPELAHSVHVEVAGLQPARWYWYRFHCGKDVSAVGRTRTLPAVDVMPERFRFAFVSCQNYEQGLFTAYSHLLKEELDLVIHLGDYIYEYAGKDGQVRKHLGPECTTLAGYRTRYAQYKLDPALRAMHQAVPWVVTPDDHEFDNNCAGDISEEKGVEPKDFLVRRAAAYQAYYEHMPLRRAALPKGPDMLLFRRLPVGRLAELHVLDTRQYRSDQPCGDGNKPPCPESLSPTQTLMGTAQRDWLFDGLSRSSATWNVLAQQVMMGRVDRKPGEGVSYSMDQWPGYEMERRKLLRFLHEKKIVNPVVLSGDIHTNWANELIADFDDLGGRTVATEFVGSSISSGGNGIDKPKDLDRILADNPFLKFHNAKRGFVRCELTPTHWRTDYRTVSFVDKPGAPLNTRASFVVEAGDPHIKLA